MTQNNVSKGISGRIGDLVWHHGLKAAFFLVVGLIAYSFYPFDQDGDGVADEVDKCVNTAGIADANIIILGSTNVRPGCENPDRDGDGFPNTAVGWSWSGSDLDQCPDKVGDAEHFGCPPPTPEEVAMKAWSDVETNCSTYRSYFCQDAAAKLAALPVAEQTEARKAKVVEAEQEVLVWEIKSTSEAWQIESLEANLLKVPDEAKRKELRVEVDRELWVGYYASCDVIAGICYSGDEDGTHQMTRAEAFVKIVAFLPFEEAFVNPTDLVEMVGNGGGYNFRNAMLAGYELGLSEKEVYNAIGLHEIQEITLSADCNDKGLVYRQALSYGWSRAPADQCAKLYLESYRYKSGTAFAWSVGLPDMAAQIERAAVDDSLRNGVYSVTASGERVITIEDREEWHGS